MSVGEASVLRGNQDIARDRQLEAAGHGRTVDSGDHRPRKGSERVHRVVDGAADHELAGIRRLRELAQIEPGAKGAARAGQHGNAGLTVVGQRRERVV